MIGLLIAATVGLIVSIFGTNVLIHWLLRHRIGQPIRKDGPQGHVTKAGTPTMGGVAIVAGTFAGYLVAHVRENVIFTRSGILLMLLILGAGGVGLLDDWIKVSRERNLGLTSRAKILGLLTVAISFSWLSVEWANAATDLTWTRASLDVDLGTVGFIVFAVLVVIGSSNAVNLTDGLDGLAAGSAIYTFIAFVVIGFWKFRNFGEIYDVPHALDLAVVAAAMLGACMGFLWWNAAPAQIFMGDTGSLAIGAGLAGLALLLQSALLLPIVGGLFVLETVSVMMQVATFKTFGGRRVFRMAPIHHHFELGGWPETTVIIRFWMLAGFFTAIGLGFFYGDFISVGGTELTTVTQP